MSVRTGLFGLKKSERIKFDLQEGGFLTIFEKEINYLKEIVENIKLVLDKVKKRPIILLETYREY